eukprot:scaffold82127_cov31-Tisochrysis_lutea.AAC.5
MQDHYPDLVDVRQALPHGINAQRAGRMRLQRTRGRSKRKTPRKGEQWVTECCKVRPDQRGSYRQ